MMIRNIFEIPPCTYPINQFTSWKGRFLHKITNLTFFAHGGIQIKIFVVYVDTPGFHLVALIITDLKDHMTCYEF